MSVISNVIEQNANCQIILGGDFNVDFSRNWLHSSLLNEFCDQALLFPAVKHECNTVDYTYHFGMQRFNVLDHFILSGGLYDTAMTKLAAIHDVDNTSDHEPLALSIAVSRKRLALTARQFIARPAWAKATAENIQYYHELLQENLRLIDIPYAALLCTNTMCCASDHCMAINKLANDITRACIDASNIAIPCTGGHCKRRPIPGRTELVEPYRVKSMFWHNLWADCDRPATGEVATIMRRRPIRERHIT